MKTVQFSRAGVTLNCLELGTGDDVVVLLHGLAGSAREMLPTAAALQPEHRVIMLDQRGHGDSTRRPADVSRRTCAEDVAAVIERFAGGRPVTLAGQSMGGHTALLTAAWFPDLVGRLVLLEAGVGGGDDGYPARLGDWFASWPVPFPDRAAAAAFLGSESIARAWLDDLEPCPGGLRPRFDADVMHTTIAAVAETARWDEWALVAAPTLLVTAEHGKIDPAEPHRMRQARPGVTHAVVEGSGHDVHLDKPDDWVRLLKHFLAR